MAILKIWKANIVIRVGDTHKKCESTPISFADKWYSKKAFMKAYGPMIHLISSQEMWSKTWMAPLQILHGLFYGTHSSFWGYLPTFDPNKNMTCVKCISLKNLKKLIKQVKMNCWWEIITCISYISKYYNFL